MKKPPRQFLEAYRSTPDTSGFTKAKGKTPAEACGINVEGKNKWKTLIENASKEKTI